MSKTYGMAGWRVGFVVGNAEIVERINLLNDHSRVGIFAPVQAATIAALEGPQDSVDERVDAYARRRASSQTRSRSRSSARAPSSSGSACLKALTAESLLVEHRVAIAPGEGFGPSGAGWARLSLAVTDETIERGAERLQRAFQKVSA